MTWKFLLVIFNELDVTLEGNRFTDKLIANKRTEAINAINNMKTFVERETKKSMNISITINEYKTANRLSLRIASNGDKTPWVAPNDLTNNLALNGAKLNWGDYDSIFCVYPWDSGLSGAGYAVKALGFYSPHDSFGATYATIPSIWRNVDRNEGEIFTHEWIHGLNGFFDGYNYTIPPFSSHPWDDTRYNYRVDPKGSWNKYYADYLKGNVRNQAPPPNLFAGGITSGMWKTGTPSSPNKLIGLGSSNPTDFRNAFRGQKGIPLNNKNRKAHRWGNGEIQDILGPNGEYALMKGSGRKCYVVPPSFWRKYKTHGVSDIGYPTNDVHRWGNGEIQDYERTNGWHAGIMKRDGSSSHFLVKGKMWKAYVATKGNGATSHLGYPKGEEYTWTQPKTGKKYYVQFYEGGYTWAQRFSPYKIGNDKTWGQQSTKETFTPPSEDEFMFRV